MRGRAVGHFVLAGACVAAAAPLVGGAALARDPGPSLYLRAPAKVSAGKAERITVAGVTNDAFDELVVYQNPKACETTNEAQARRPYLERIVWESVSQSRHPAGNTFIITITVKHEVKGEHLMCGFLVNGGTTGAHASLHYKAT
jgi:hypothetical protein